MRLRLPLCNQRKKKWEKCRYGNCAVRPCENRKGGLRLHAFISEHRNCEQKGREGGRRRKGPRETKRMLFSFFPVVYLLFLFYFIFSLGRVEEIGAEGAVWFDFEPSNSGERFCWEDDLALFIIILFLKKNIYYTITLSPFKPRIYAHLKEK